MKLFVVNSYLRTLLLSLFVSLTLFPCNFAQKRAWHESGVNIQKAFTVEPFTSLNVSVPMDVTIVPSNQYRIVMSVDSALLPLISMQVVDQTLSISLSKKNYFSSKSKGLIMVYVDSLYNLKNNSVGNVMFSDTLHGSHFNMINESVGNTAVMVIAPQITIRNASVGKLSLWVKTDSLFFNNNAVGSTLISGFAVKSLFENSGVGSLNAKGLINQTLYLKNSAVGSSDVFASKAFYVTNSAVGHLTLYGHGEIKELIDKGLSKTKHITN
ncbi:MAG: GIN domain-containing protein [Microbacter sp.]